MRSGLIIIGNHYYENKIQLCTYTYITILSYYCKKRASVNADRDFFLITFEFASFVMHVFTTKNNTAIKNLSRKHCFFLP